MAAFTVRVPDETAEKLDQLAKKMDRSRAYLTAQAIDDYISRDGFATDEEVTAAFAKFGVKA